jgi:hypothetical protein
LALLKAAQTFILSVPWLYQSSRRVFSKIEDVEIYLNFQKEILPGPLQALVLLVIRQSQRLSLCQPRRAEHLEDFAYSTTCLPFARRAFSGAQ